ncbi:efflux RND transporter periplasmic adaptor subunit [Ruficoccus amylovorans]|uniref:Efflux RND transporter periplasmic adaptor subunit n=1 Tax=Ruficoccus amylovorans TaxID=1804625 RepID=A0A842HG57_9BACT|nr:efflux RND transporter periplasmic adaptor subunit [Ruficoccus amylovorans]MBC2595180.1 efflux RND transporter periplasmic adaptor subunit [Ruficoccus amylovorans]
MMVSALATLAFAALAVYFFFAPAPGRENERAAPPPPPVLTGEVEEIVWDETVRALGNVRANEQAMLSPKITERVIAVNFESGQHVEKGHLLIQLNDAEQQAQLEEMQASLDERSQQLERVRSVEGSGALSRSVIDEEISRFNVARAQLDLAKARVDDRRIYAPFDGVLGLRDLSPGELVEAGDDLVEIIDLTPVKVDFTVPERNFAQIAPGLKITARSESYPGRVFEGEVRSVSPNIDPVSRSARVRAFVSNEDFALRPGMLLLVELNLGSKSVLTVPESALSPIGDQQYIYRVTEDGLAERVPVRVGRRQKGVAELLEGLEKGDAIITHGHRARSGQPVNTLTQEQVFNHSTDS